ncbi:MAG: hypothetical protein ACRDRX_02875 [Pseudonocardiaceae bacterium]
MNKLQLDLETLEVERLDVSVTALSGGLELLGMGHASPELSQSCDTAGACGTDMCGCSGDYESASCDDGQCGCDSGA